MMYGPPMTDSEDDDDDLYEGFSFGDEFDKKKKNNCYIPPPNLERDLYYATINGNLTELENVLKEIHQNNGYQYNVNSSCDNGLALIHYACLNGHLDLVSFLVNIKQADVNLEIDSETPLLSVCQAKKEKNNEQYELNLKKITELLLNKDAIINVSNKYGLTPLLLACREGHLEIVKLIIKDSALDVSDNEGKTILYHAIEGNNIEIVKFLLEYGVDCNTYDRKGYSPSQIAENYGFHDIYEILPKEEIKYVVPTTFVSYSSIFDHLPRIFLKTEIPEYFQEVYIILSETNMLKFTENFALAGVNLNEFLIINDDRLEKIGIEYKFQRDRILMALLHFHLNHWSKKTIKRVKSKDTESFYDILMISANILKNLIVINSSIKYVQQNLVKEQYGKLKLDKMNLLKFNIQRFKKNLIELSKTAKYIQQFSPPKSPLYIDYEEYKYNCKKNKAKSCFKYSLIIGISIVICLKYRNIL